MGEGVISDVSFCFQKIQPVQKHLFVFDGRRASISLRDCHTCSDLCPPGVLDDGKKVRMTLCPAMYWQ